VMLASRGRTSQFSRALVYHRQMKTRFLKIH
jgi:hypothetical protein